MGNRILKESICMSDTIDQLSWFEEVFFYRLLVNADDFGRFDGRLPIIKARLFPLKNVSDKDITKAISSLEKHELLATYDWDDKPIIQIITWDHHQSVRNKRSKFPAINGDVSISAMQNIEMIQASGQKTHDVEINCNQLKSIESNCSRARGIQSNPIQYESISESESNTPYIPHEEKRMTSAERFAQFWSAYPRKVGKGAAERAWKTLKVDDDLLKTILDAIEAQKKGRQWTSNNGQYIPHPTTWLNQKRWLDEVDSGVGRDGHQRTLNRYGTEPGGLGVKDYMGGDDDEQ